MNKYTQEHYDFIAKNVKGLSNKELLKLVNDKFNNLFSLKTLKAYKANNKLSSGLTGQFEKGHVPTNKGKKLSRETYEKIKSTMFKKGNIPQNHRPIGSERVNTKDNLIQIKIAEPNKWQYKQRYIWEKETGNKIPKDRVIIFLDGNQRNFEPSNLACISKNENLRLNQKKLRSEHADITLTNINIVRLDNVIKEKMEGKRQNNGKC